MPSQRNTLLIGGDVEAPALSPILGAARRVILDNGPRAATMAEVARTAGVSRMTVYRHHRSREQLVSDLLTAHFSAFLQEADARSADLTEARERVVETSVILTSTVGSDPLFLRIVADEPSRLLPLMTRRLGQSQQLALRHLRTALSAGMAGSGGDGSIRTDRPETLALTCLTICQSFVFAAPALAAQMSEDTLTGELRLALDRYLRPDDSRPDPQEEP